MNRSIKDIRIVFMGTPEFAVASLAALINAGANIVGVITAPDKQAGRGMQLSESAVKKFAIEHKLNIFQPSKLKDHTFIAELEALKADLQVVVAFRMLPEIVWNMPPMGTINVHGSLLPQYRGAAPINWAVINGEKHTGVTTFKLQHAIDTGNILLQESFPINENDTAGDVHDKMKEIGATLLISTIDGILNNSIQEKEQSQDNNTLQHAPKIYTETGAIDFNRSVNQVHDLVRGLSPFPGAYTMLDGKTLKVFRTNKEYTTPTHETGKLVSDGKQYLKFACSDGYIQIEELQLAGKKKMKTADFLRGYRLPE